MTGAVSIWLNSIRPKVMSLEKQGRYWTSHRYSRAAYDTADKRHLSSVLPYRQTRQSSEKFRTIVRSTQGYRHQSFTAGKIGIAYHQRNDRDRTADRGHFGFYTLRLPCESGVWQGLCEIQEVMRRGCRSIFSR